MPSSLYYYEGKYILVLFPIGPLGSDSGLCEFGDPLIYLPEYESFLQEHGKTLIASRAVRILNEKFPNK